MRSSFLFVALLTSILGCSHSASAPRQASILRQTVERDGRPFDLWQGREKAAATVLMFTRSDCPISNRYAPTLRALYDQFQKRGVDMFLVYVDPREDWAGIRRHMAEYRYTCPALRDPSHVLVAECKATVTPEAAVFDAHHHLMYHGRIDDWFIDFGQSRSEASTHELADAVEAVLANKPVAQPYVEAVGCYISDLKEQSFARMLFRLGWLVMLLCPLSCGCGGARTASSSDQATVTYCRDVAPILFARCANCHRPGETSPFSLLTYEDARARAAQIRDVTRRHFMPPWLPDDGPHKFQAERRLTNSEIETISKWANAGAPQGDPRDLPPTPKFTAGWQLGTPDLVLESPAFELPASGADRFRNFVLQVPIDKPHWIRAVELRPENPRVTHHARIGIDTTLESARRDAADAEPGYEGMAWGQDPKGQLITWTPGMLPDLGIAGAAWKLEPGVGLVLHTHLQPSGKPETVRFRVGLHYADGPPSVRPMVLRIGSRNIDIPGGQSTYETNDEYELPIDVELHSIFPHAHKLCQEINVRAVLPNGATEPLIKIQHFDEKWHDKYRLAQPLRLPKGTRLVAHFTYDNSAANPRNPHRPPQRVVYGSNAVDEMSDVYLQVTPVDPDQFAVLDEFEQRADLNSKIVGYRKTLDMYPHDVWSLEGLASSYVAGHQQQKAIDLLEKATLPADEAPQAKTILAMARLSLGDAHAAKTTLLDALRANNQMPLAWAGLGQALAKLNEAKDAQDAFERAVQIAPQLTVARLDLVDLLIQQDRLDDAAAAAKAAADLAPDDHLPLLKLASIYARQKKYDAALASFAAAKKIAPFVYSPQSSLAIACYEQGDEETAARLLNEAAKLDPNDPVPPFFEGQISRRNSDTARARTKLQQSLELPVPGSWPASHVHQFRKVVYAEQLQLAKQLQDEQLARQVLTAWTQLEPENDAVRKMLAGLNK